MTKTSLTANQPRFSIRTYSLGAASVLLAYACLAAAPVASANTTTNPSTSPTIAQTTNSTTEQKNNQVSQSSTNQTNTTPSTKSNTEQISQEKNVTGTTTSAIQPIQTTTPSTSPASQTRSQQTTPSSQQSQNQTRQTSTNQIQTNTSSTSSSAISQTTSTRAQTNTNRNRLTTQARTTSTRSSSTSALGDDYPYTAVDAIDPWRLYTRQCTSFVAFRLSKVNGFEIPPAYGNADVWGYRAQREGYRVDMSPAVGSVAWWTSPMHVAWVSSIQGDMVEIEEYNYGTRYTYNRRLIHKNSVSGYIHFKDLAGSPVSQTSPAPTQTHTSGLANSGTYTFTQQAPIKNEAKQSSTTLDYYYAGESVRYDRVLTADGYQWISYLSYSGQRRYIPIKQVQSSPAPQQPIVSTPTKPQGTIHITNINQAEGSFEVIVTNVKSPKTIKSVSIPIWSDNNGQDDIIWYPAQRQSDGSYKVNVQASKHKNDRGLYHIHVYYTDSSNKLEFITGTTTQLTAISQQTNQTNSNLPASGTYYFKSKAIVRNSPNQSASEITYYGAGSSVRYDRVVTSEGRQWISYISYSGARRYIAIP
ncbi:SH3 domain-containing protein [Streptococcus suis]|uniref:N-acetylmuramoyl-L-alanine amidase n=2 Tax=Streptococcus suis TaxID=1307 RepID=A0A116MMC0_STRSU|nr:SH3 domain-containing protein [Streptococcus suis]CYU97379.1 surface antigen [Streptococcus suis]CYV55626.1 surface antigen [Streptococcus suis]